MEMADSLSVPHVPSSSVKVAIPAALIEQADQAVTQTGLPRDELIELVLRSRLDTEGSPAADIWSQYRASQAQSPADVVAAVTAAGVPDGVRGLRLGPPSPDRNDIPWSRPGIGAELWWSATEVWPVVRGLWRMDPSGVTVIAALRLGHVLGVYRVHGWRQEPESGRRYAVAGSIITDEGRLLDADSGEDQGEASAHDLAIRAAVTAAPILMPPARQPVVKLSR